MTLAQWVKKVGTQQKAADILGVHFTTINTWLRQRRAPNRRHMIAIVEKTKGAVTYRDLIGLTSVRQK